MRIALFCHSLRSDWHHGNAHFLRGVATELVARGHEVRAFEAAGGWSARNLVADHGPLALHAYRSTYPWLSPVAYEPGALDLDRALDGVDLALVHEWNDPDLVRRVGQHRRASRRYRLLFHDTHHRAVTSPADMAAYDLSSYDGVLAFGEVLRRLYLERGWTERAFTWHEAADTRVFCPDASSGADRRGGLAGDVVWIGNWGDGERSAELAEYLIDPVRALGLSGRVHGVRYPDEARQALRAAGLAYMGYVPNFAVPRVFARFAVTVHVPRRPYAEALPGIPTIRPFEAMACGIPLVCAPWSDVEGLFTPGRDYLVARTGDEMRRHLRDLLRDPGLAREIAAAGRRTVLARHTCAHRVDELLAIAAELGVAGTAPGEGGPA